MMATVIYLEAYTMGIQQEAPIAAALTGATLTAWRERMGYTQREACEALGCSRSNWQRWEQGTVPVPRYIGLACSALAMNMSAYDAEKGA